MLPPRAGHGPLSTLTNWCAPISHNSTSAPKVKNLWPGTAATSRSACGRPIAAPSAQGSRHPWSATTTMSPLWFAATCVAPATRLKASAPIRPECSPNTDSDHPQPSSVSKFATSHHSQAGPNQPRLNPPTAPKTTRCSDAPITTRQRYRGDMTGQNHGVQSPPPNPIKYRSPKIFLSHA